MAGSAGAGTAEATRHRFRAHARDEGRHRDHPVPDAADIQEAAVIFAEHWLASDADGEVSVIVRDLDTGEQQCFVIDLSSGGAEPCD